MSKTVLIVDGGGRGAVLVDKYSQSAKISKILCVPGNDLMSLNSKRPVKIYPNLKTTSISEIIGISEKEKVDLVDVNQDDAVAAGLVDELLKQGIRAVGPTRLAGQIEWDKAWARDFMKKNKIPHPKYQICVSPKEGVAFLKKQKDSPWFIKASGLTLGKGVLPARNNREAIRNISCLKEFGAASKTFLIEEALVGEEFSSYAICDGKNFKILGHAQDNKRLNNFDEGPNTGGIGSSSPPGVLRKNHLRQVENIFEKTFRGLKKEDRVYVGILYLGGMIVSGKVYVIEFNSRWGDPEAEVILPGLLNDYYDLNLSALSGKLNEVKIKNDGKYRLVMTGCSKGYPGNYSSVLGKRIFGLADAVKNGIKIYGAGVKKEGKKHMAFGGRLFHLMADGKNVLEARERAYQAMAQISVEGNNLHYRTDIGWRDVERLRNGT